MDRIDRITIMNWTLDCLQAIPKRVIPLLSLYLRLSKNGKQPIFASARWMANELGCVRSTYYEWRKILVDLLIINVEKREISPAYNKPSLVHCASIKAIAARLWQRVQSAVCPAIRTQKGSIIDRSFTKRTHYGYRKSPLYQQLMLQGLRKKPLATPT